MLAGLAISEQRFRATAPSSAIPWGALLETLLRTATTALLLACGYGLMAFRFGP